MTLSPEHRIRTIAWCVATALHICAGVLILRAASWGDVNVRSTAADHAGVVMLTLIRAEAAAPDAVPGPGRSTTPSARDAPSAAKPPPAAPLGSLTLAARSAGSPAGEPHRPATESAQMAVSDLSGVDADRFRQALLAQIARYNQYPPEAMRDRVQGTVWVRFLLDRNGRLLDVWVDQSSGQPVLDDEAVAAVKRAAPFPSIPSGLPDQMDLTLGIPFVLG